MNRTARLLGVSTPTVMAWTERFAEAYAQKPEPEGRAVVVELKIVGTQTGDRLSGRIGNGGIDLHRLDAAREACLWLLLGLRGCGRKSRAQCSYQPDPGKRAVEAARHRPPRASRRADICHGVSGHSRRSYKNRSAPERPLRRSARQGGTIALASVP